MKNIKNLKEDELQRLSGMWLVKSTELQWKANKMKLRLTKRLEREAKRHLAILPVRKQLADAQVILEALLPHGESIALDLVRAQITACEAKIADVMYRYRLLFPEEIALKEMEVELAEMRAEKARTAKEEVDLELESRGNGVEEVESDTLNSISTAPVNEVAPNTLPALYRRSAFNVPLGLVHQSFQHVSIQMHQGIQHVWQLIRWKWSLSPKSSFSALYILNQ